MIAMILGTVTLNESSKADTVDIYDTYEGKTINCVIDLNRNDLKTTGLETGFNYELLKQFAKAVNAEVNIYAGRDESDYVDSLKDGRVDILVLPEESEISDKEVIVSKNIDNVVWAVNSKDIAKVKELNTWIVTYSKSKDFQKIKSKYTYSRPISAFTPGKIVGNISPYDSIIKRYAAKLDWDWRMLAAVIYQESKFAIDITSHRGATGLMQVMPGTAAYYGDYDLLDPEDNIEVGTMHLGRLQNMFKDSGMDDEEKIKFVLASYNAGEGRIADCRNFARENKLDSNRWDDILKVIPMMRNEDVASLDYIKFGKFYGTETITYVDNILRLYTVFCEICPA